MRNELIALLLVVMALLGVGVITVYSVNAVRPGGEEIFVRHCIHLALGLACMVVATRMDYHVYSGKYVFRGIALITLALLVFVLVSGEEVRGAKRWIRLAGFQFQPSELAKLAVVMFLALKLTENQAQVKSFFRGFLPPLAIAMGFAALIAMEPDLGVPIVIVATAFIMMFVAGVRLRYLVASVAPVLAGVGVLVVAYPYRLRRLVAWLDPWEFAKTTGFHLIQSLAAFGRGSITGVGPGAGEQKLFYLPDAHTDFIFAAWGEEMGLVGTLFVVLLFAALVVLGIRIAAFAPDLFGSLLATGIVSLITCQAMFNIAVAIGLLPTKGLPLPFVSCGGTSTLAFLTLAGILVNIGRQAEAPERRLMPAY